MRSTLKTILFAAVLSTALICSARPIDIPDEQHLANGCFISASRFIAEVGMGKTQTVELPDGRLHTLAVIVDSEGTWIRDEFMGVVPVKGNVQRSYTTALRRWLKTASKQEIELQTNERIPRTYDERLVEVKRAQALLRIGDVVEVNTSRGIRPVLIWTSGKVMHCYDPEFGTIKSEIACSSDAYARAALKAVGIKLS